MLYISVTEVEDATRRACVQSTQTLLPTYTVAALLVGITITHTHSPPRFRRGYPLNLSISVSGGKETNRDILSRGDRNG